MTLTKIPSDDVASNLLRLRNWTYENGKLHKLFKFKTFREAMQFMVGVGFHCEKMNHHPQWYNVYGNVDVELVTHKVAGITELDFKLAEKMDEIENRDIAH